MKMGVDSTLWAIGSTEICFPYHEILVALRLDNWGESCVLKPKNLQVMPQNNQNKNTGKNTGKQQPGKKSTTTTSPGKTKGGKS